MKNNSNIVVVRINGEQESYQFPTREDMQKFIAELKEKLPEAEYIFITNKKESLLN